MDDNATDAIDLAQLRSHVREKPRTKAGQVRQAWPDIKQLLAAGHSLKDVCRWLNEVGLHIGYARLSDYVCQLRRRDMTMAGPAEIGSTANPITVEEPPHPLAHILEREKKHAVFNYNAEPDPKKLI